MSRESPHYFHEAVLEVKSYDAAQAYHECRMLDGQTVKIDLMVNGDFKDVDPKSLVGKVVHIHYAHPYISIAANVSIVCDMPEAA